MADYIAQARAIAADLPDDPTMRREAIRRFQALSTLALAEAVTALKPPQDATGAGDGVSPSSRPAEPSLVALDGIEGRLIEAARKAARTWDIEAPRQAPEWWFEIAAVMELARQMGTKL